MTDEARERPGFSRPLTDTEYRAARNRNWENIDKNTKDSNGDLIIYGAEYSYSHGSKYPRVWACGPDVRGNSGHVFCWVERDKPENSPFSSSSHSYECLLSQYMTPNKEENEETERVIEALKDITLKDVKDNPERFKEF